MGATWRINAVAGKVKYCGVLEQQRGKQVVLFADDGYFGGGDFESDEFVGGVGVEKDFEVGGVGLQGFVGFSSGGGLSRGFDGYRAGGRFLRDDHRKNLGAVFVAIVNAGAQCEL